MPPGTPGTPRERLRDEARYRRERLALYRARLYSGRAVSREQTQGTRARLGGRGRPPRAGRARPMTILEILRKRRARESNGEVSSRSELAGRCPHP